MFFAISCSSAIDAQRFRGDGPTDSLPNALTKRFPGLAGNPLREQTANFFASQHEVEYKYPRHIISY